MGRDIHELERKGKRHSKREDTEPSKQYLAYLKEQGEMISLTTNTRGNTMMEPNFKTLAGPQLVVEYNKMAESNIGWELNIKPVKKFSDTLTGIKRCEALALSIKTRKEGGAVEETAQTTNSEVSMSDENAVAPTEETPMTTPEKKEKKAKAKKTAKAAKPAKTEKKAVATNGSGVKQEKIAVEFDARAGSYREKLLVTLHNGFRKQVTVNALLKGVYGNMNTENKGALMMVMKGALATIKKNRLPYQIKKEKNAETKEISFGLYPNK